MDGERIQICVIRYAPSFLSIRRSDEGNASLRDVGVGGCEGSEWHDTRDTVELGTMEPRMPHVEALIRVELS